MEIENTYGRHCLASQDIVKLVIWRLRNQFLEVGKILVQQKIGVGQGDNHSWHLCRLYTIWREGDFKLNGIIWTKM